MKGLFINGKRINNLENALDWTKTSQIDIDSPIESISVMCLDKGVIGGIIASTDTGVVTDKNWRCTSVYQNNW